MGRIRLINGVCCGIIVRLLVLGELSLFVMWILMKVKIMEVNF